MHFISAFMAVLFAVALDTKEISKRMIRGTAVKPGEFPWTAGFFGGCGAVMIHPQVALTAAHCVCHMNARGFCNGTIGRTLVVGAIKGTGEDATHIIDVDRHNIVLLGENPDTFYKDFAVIILKDRLPAGTPTISLPKSSPKRNEDEECYILGMGFSGNCTFKPSLNYIPCGANNGIVGRGGCYPKGCCHYKYSPRHPGICYFYPGQCQGITHRLCRYLTEDKPKVTEQECRSYGCCYNTSSDGQIGECYDNYYIENHGKKGLQKVEVFGVVDERGWIVVNSVDPHTVRGTCKGDSGGPCRKVGSEKWTLYEIASGGVNCGIETRYWNVYNSIPFIMSVVPKDVADDLAKDLGI